MPKSWSDSSWTSWGGGLHLRWQFYGWPMGLGAPLWGFHAIINIAAVLTGGHHLQPGIGQREGEGRHRARPWGGHSWRPEAGGGAAGRRGSAPPGLPGQRRQSKATQQRGLHSGPGTTGFNTVCFRVVTLAENTAAITAPFRKRNKKKPGETMYAFRGVKI